MQNEHKNTGKEETKAPRRQSRAKKFFKWSFRILLSFFVLLIVTALLLRLPAVQTFLAQKLAGYFSDKWGVEIHIDKVEIKFFSSVELKGLTIGDHHQDTLLRAGSLEAGIDYFRIRQNALSISHVYLDDALFRLHKYPNEKGMNLDWFIKKFKSDKPKDTTASKPFDFIIRTIRFRNVAFNLIDETTDSLPARFQANNIRTLVSQGDFTDFRIAKDSIIFHIDQLQARDHSGVGFSDFKSDFCISSSCLMFENTAFKTLSGSAVNGDIRMLYNSWSSYSQFMDSVRFDCKLTNTTLHTKDIGYFAGNLEGLDMVAEISTRAKGPVSNLRLRDLDIRTGNNTRIQSDIEMRGLPNINETFFNLEAQNIQTTIADLESFPMPPFGSNRRLALPEQVRNLQYIAFTGTFTGFYNDFVSYGKFTTGAGSLFTDLKLSGDTAFDNPHYSGRLRSEGINLATILGTEVLGPAVFDLNIKGHSFDPKEMELAFDGDIRKFTLNGYTYSDISTRTEFVKNTIDGLVTVRDPNVQLDAQAYVDLREKQPHYIANVRIQEWDLLKTNIYNDTLTLAKARLDGDIQGSNIDNMVGWLRADSIYFFKEDRGYSLSRLQVNADTIETTRTFSVSSDYIDAHLAGHFKFVPLYNNILMNVNRYLPSLHIPYDPRLAATDEAIAFDIQFKNIKPITEVFVPAFYMEENSEVNGIYRTNGGTIDMVANSGGVGYGNIRLLNWTLSLDNNEREIEVNTRAERFHISDSTYFSGVRLISEAYTDSVTITLDWLGDSYNITRGFFKVGTLLGADSSYTLTVFPSYFALQEMEYRLRTSSSVVYNTDGIRFEKMDFRASNGQVFSIEGKAGKNSDDILSLHITRFPLAFANRFIGSEGSTDLRGYISGDIGAHRLMAQPFFEADLSGDSLYLNNNALGTLRLKSEYDIEQEMLAINSTLSYNNRYSLSVNNGKFYPLRKSNQFDIPLSLDDFNIGVAELFLAPVFSEMAGTISGNLHLYGSLKKPDLRGNALLTDAAFTVPIIGTRYQLNSDNAKSIVLNSQEINFGTIRVKDQRGESAVITGRIKHSYFSDMELDVALRARNFLFLNTRYKEGDAFYGTIPATGNVSIDGPFDDIKITANVTTNAGGKLFLPMNSGPSKATDNSFVIFYDSRDTAKNINDIRLQKNISVVSLDMFVDVTEDCEVQIIFDERVGDVLKAQGRGSLRIELNKLYELSMYGEYEVYKGDYLFTLENVINKKLQLRPGGMIYWSGDPYTAKINASAMYEVRTSPFPLMQNHTLGSADSMKYKSKTTTQVIVNLKGDLMNPLISFDIEFPTQSDEFKTAINERLTSEDERNKQAFALLVLRQFVPPSNASGSIGFSGGGAASSSSLEVLSNQLSNWLSSLTGNVDLGVRYRGADGTSSGSNEVELNVSGKFLNDRIVVDGNFGVATNNTASGSNNNNASKTAGIIDVNIEYKITNDGKLRLRAFNRSNDGYLTVAFPYTQGVGLTYSTSFDTWKEVKFKKKRKKTEEKAAQQKKAVPDTNTPPAEKKQNEK